MDSERFGVVAGSSLDPDAGTSPAQPSNWGGTTGAASLKYICTSVASGMQGAPASAPLDLVGYVETTSAYFGVIAGSSLDLDGGAPGKDEATAAQGPQLGPSGGQESFGVIKGSPLDPDA